MEKMDEMFDGSDAHLLPRHTTTPWSLQECDSDPALYQILDGDGKVIGFPRRGTGGNAEKRDCLQNALLWAAAPDLMAALLELRYARTDKAEKMADAAITKGLHGPSNA